LLNSHDQELTFGDLVEIRKQSALEEAERPEYEPRDRTVTVLQSTVGFGLNESGIKMFANSGWKEQRTAATGQGIMTNFAFRDEILKDKQGPLSRQSTAFDFFHALQLLLLDVGDDNPDDWPAA